MRHAHSLVVTLLCLLATASFTYAANPTPTHADLLVAKVNDVELRLDLYMPKDTPNPPLVVFIHGGGWHANSYKKCLTPWLTESGFAVASIGYRLTDKATFPAQIHDVKGAVRWLRAHAKEYGYDVTRVGVAGTSAGGHLATLLGVTAGNKELEGDIGGNLDQSSRVDAIVDYYGPMDFVLRSQTQPSKTESPKGPVYGLLGGPASKNLELARLASPAFHVTKDDPPLLIIHGDKDTTVLHDQSQRILDVYKEVGLDASLEIVPGAGHGGKECFDAAYREKVAAFLNKHLRPQSDSK
ncbi:MAG: alpha/beta hydrolase fold domain-containing protein [Phycisphaera sp.]|nr:alpha/beta hydrolase fold domain-containing protein [Phycisphaera sp.]